MILHITTSAVLFSLVLTNCINGMPQQVQQQQNQEVGWPTDTLVVPPEDLYDCIYLFFVCTDKASGAWPENKSKCTKMFDACQSKLGLNVTDPDSFNGIESPIELIAGLDNNNDNNNNTETSSSSTVGNELQSTEAQTEAVTEEATEAVTNNPDENQISNEVEDTGPVTLPVDLVVQGCSDLLANGSKSTGVYTVQIGPDRKEVFCDMQTLGGGWTVIQRRGVFPAAQNPPDYFFKNWTDYVKGFGAANNELWLGLESIFLLTNKEPMQLLITLDDWEGNRVGLFVNEYRLANALGAYRIFYNSFSSDLGKSLPARGTKFSTIDRDNDAWSNNCAVRFSGAWWYSACHNSNLNGLYLRGEHESFGDGVNWYHWKGYHYSLKNTVMKIRPQRMAPTTTPAPPTTTSTTPAPA